MSEVSYIADAKKARDDLKKDLNGLNAFDKEHLYKIETGLNTFYLVYDDGTFALNNGKKMKLSEVRAIPKRVLSVDGGEDWVEIELEESVIKLPIGAFANPSYYKNELKKAAEKGLPVEARSRFLSSINAAIHTALREKNIIKEVGYDSLGWNNNKFIIPGDNDYIGQIQTRNDVKGDTDLQLAFMRELIIKHSTFGALCAVALSGFLHGLIKTDHCPIFHIHGIGGKGKTSALLLIASMIGSPEIGENAAVGWDSTAAGIENILMSLQHQFCIIDDLSLIDGKTKQPEKIRETLFKIANGGGRAVAKQNGDLRKMKTWDLQVMSSGNRKIAGIIGTDTEQAKALLSRVTEMDISEFPIFENVENGFFEELRKHSHLNYGNIFQRIIEVLSDSDFIKELEGHYYESIGHYFEAVKENRKASSISLYYVSTLILQEVFKLSIDEVYKVQSKLNKILISQADDLVNNESSENNAKDKIATILAQKLMHLKMKNGNGFFYDHNHNALKFGVIGEIQHDELTNAPHEIEIENIIEFVLYDSESTKENLQKIGIQLDELIADLKKADMLKRISGKFKGNVKSGNQKGWKIVFNNEVPF